MVDDILYKAVKGISDVINGSGEINIDFEDAKTTLEGAGDAHIAIGHGKGDERAEQAVDEVVNSPLLETSIKNAGKLLVNFVISDDTPLEDVAKVMELLTESAAKDVQVIHGVTFDSSLEDEIIITVIATCFKDGSDNTLAKPDGVATKTVLASAPAEQTVSEQPLQTISEEKPFSESLVFPATPGSADDDDPFSALSELLNSRGN